MIVCSRQIEIVLKQEQICCEIGRSLENALEEQQEQKQEGEDCEAVCKALYMSVNVELLELC